MAAAVLSRASERPLTFQEVRIKEEVTQKATTFKESLYTKFSGYLEVDSSLTDTEKALIDEIASYPTFAEQLTQDESLLEDCFKWCLRDLLPVKVFVLHTEVARAIQEIALSRRLNLIFKDMLQISEDGIEVTIPIATSLKDASPKRYNILNKDTAIEFEGGKVYTIGQIFKEFKNRKANGKGEFEVINGAIRPWGPDGTYTSLGEKIDTTQKHWYKELEPFKVFDTQSAVTEVLAGVLEEKDKAVIQEKFAKGFPVIRAVATADSPEFKAMGNHALIEVFLPLGNEKWGFYSFGDFPAKFPKKLTDVVGFFGNGQPGIVRYPDQSNIIAGRLQFYYTRLVTQEMAEDTLDYIGKLIALAQSGAWDGRFHPRHHNCADWTGRVMSHTSPMPEIFQIDDNEVERGKLLQRSILEVFDNYVWPMQLAYWGMLGVQSRLPVGLTVRHLQEEGFVSFEDLTG